MTPPFGTGGELTRDKARLNAWVSLLGAAVALTGVQLIAPSLPIMRDALGLTDTQLALVMSVYLLPAALASIPVGILADRLGRRVIFGGALLLFGGCGLVLVVLDSYAAFLAIRFVQGLAFAGILPLTMTILGDAFSGAELVGAQGHRSVAMNIGDAVLPVVGGLLVVGGWQLPWLGQALAIPLGFVVLWKLVDAPVTGTPPLQKRARLRDLAGLFRSRPIIALQYAGFLRLFLKISILTFLPVFLVDIRQQSTAFVGLTVGVAALAGTAVAALSGRLARKGRPTRWVMVGIAGMGVALVGMVTLPWVWGILGSAVVYGASNGLIAVFTNALVTVATGPEHRSSFVAATGAVRNFAKSVAPAAFAALILVLPITVAFVLVGLLTLGSVAVLGFIEPLEERLIDHQSGDSQ